MASSLSNLVNNLSGRIYNIKYKHGRDKKNVKNEELNIKIANAFLNTQINTEAIIKRFSKKE